MIRRLVIRPEAEDDLAEALDWYDAQRDGLVTSSPFPDPSGMVRFCPANGWHRSACCGLDKASGWCAQGQLLPPVPERLVDPECEE